MKARETNSKNSGKKRIKKVPPLTMSEEALARLGGGQVAYLRMLTWKVARKLFPSVEGLPKTGKVFALHAADGTPIALTDTMQAALSHAMEGELEVLRLN
jgi:hypothetical protein